jgi:hypothetical protein
MSKNKTYNSPLSQWPVSHARWEKKEEKKNKTHTTHNQVNGLHLMRVQIQTEPEGKPPNPIACSICGASCTGTADDPFGLREPP